MKNTTDYILQSQRAANTLFRADLGYPIYVVKSEFSLGAIAAFAGSGTDSLYYRDLIQERDGAGYLVVLRPEAEDKAEIASTVIHEIAHFYDSSCRKPTDESLTSWKDYPKGFQFGTAMVIGRAQPDAWHVERHQPKFWRTNFHVWIRMHDAGIRCSSLDMTFCDFKPWQMRKVLMSELEANYDRPIREILQTPAPEPFLQLFEKGTDLTERLYETINNGRDNFTLRIAWIYRKTEREHLSFAVSGT